MNNRSTLILILVLTCLAASVQGYMQLVDNNSRLIVELSLQETTLRLGQSQKLELLGTLRLVTEQGQELKKEYLSLKEQLRDSQSKIAALDTSYYRLTGLDAAMTSHAAQTAQENFSLVRGRDSLEAQFADLVKENQAYKARLGSPEELKNAIREVHAHRSGTR